VSSDARGGGNLRKQQQKVQFSIIGSHRFVQPEPRIPRPARNANQTTKIMQSSPTSERSAARRSEPRTTLDTFENAHSQRDYLIHIQIPEFTCLCPLTGQPDFAHFTIDYIPDLRCVELKALKLYMWSFRDIGAFHEKITNDLLDTVVEAISPRFARVTGRWNVRGGLYTNVVADFQAPNWTPKPVVNLTRFGLANPAAV
jgi:7-cyano-7-deazaguanine reductase